MLIGIFQLIVCASVRFSHSGCVCAGDYISTKEDYNHYLKNSDYYMKYEGSFVIGVLIYENVSFILVCISFYLVNRQSMTGDNIESTLLSTSAAFGLRGIMLLKKRITATPNIKNYKNLKYIQYLNQ